MAKAQEAHLENVSQFLNLYRNFQMTHLIKHDLIKCIGQTEDLLLTFWK